MAISFVAASYNGGTLTATEPSGTASGDAMIALVMAGEHTAQTGPSGWTQLNQVDGGNVHRSSTWWIVRGGSAPSLTWGGPSAANTSIEVLTYRGTHATTPTDGSSMLEVTGDSTPDSPSLTPTVNDDWLICFFVRGFEDPGAITIPSGMTSRFNKPSADWFAGADLSITGGSGTPTGAKTWTETGTTHNSLMSSVLIRPAAGGGGGGLPLFLQGDLLVGGMQAKSGGLQ